MGGGVGVTDQMEDNGLAPSFITRDPDGMMVCAQTTWYISIGLQALKNVA
jgi:hypothetical protein